MYFLSVHGHFLPSVIPIAMCCNNNLIFLMLELLWQVSYRFFVLTNQLKSSFVPHKDNQQLLQMAITGACISTCLYFIGKLTVDLPKLMVCFFIQNQLISMLFQILKVALWCPIYLCRLHSH